MGHFALLESIRGEWIQGLLQLHQLEGQGIQLISSNFGAVLRNLQAQWQRALDFLALRGFEMNTVVLGNVLACLRGAGRRDEALQLFDEIQKQNLQKDLTLLGVALSLCDRADLWRDALHIFQTWPYPWLDQVATGAATTSCSVAWQWQWCLRLQHESKMASLVITNAVMDAQANANNWKASIDWLNIGTLVARIEPDITTVNSAASSMVMNSAGPQWSRVIDPWSSQWKSEKPAIFCWCLFVVDRVSLYGGLGIGGQQQK